MEDAKDAEVAVADDGVAAGADEVAAASAGADEVQGTSGAADEVADEEAGNVNNLTKSQRHCSFTRDTYMKYMTMTTVALLVVVPMARRIEWVGHMNIT